MSKKSLRDWPLLKLGNLFKLLKGSIVPQDNPTERLEYYSIPVFDQTGSSIVVNGSQIESNKTLVSEPAILVSKLNPRKPRVQVVKKPAGFRQCASTEFMVYAPRDKEVDLSFFSYYFVSQYFSNKLQLVATGSTNSHVRVTPSETLSWTVPHPPLPEQKKIAAILSSVDNVIEKTRGQIDKLKDLKTGMMQELLTKGIGPGGVPHTEFKDSPVGRIPSTWSFKQLGELSFFVTSGSRGWAQYYSKSGAVFIRIGNLTREHINFRFDDTVHVTPPESAEGKRTKVQVGDVLISITADLGIVGVVNESVGEAYVNQHVSLVRLNDPGIARWVGHYLSLESSQKQFIENNDAGAKAGLNLTAIRKTLVALPPNNERNRIVAALDGIDDSVSVKRNKLHQLLSLKKALMQDLLTGKVRVNVDNKESAAA